MWIENEPIHKTLLNSQSVIELINGKIIDQLELKTYNIKETWTLQLAGDGYTSLNENVGVPVNFSGVRLERCVVTDQGSMIFDISPSANTPTFSVAALKQSTFLIWSLIVYLTSIISASWSSVRGMVSKL